MSSSNEKDEEGNATLNERWQLIGRNGSVSIGQTRPPSTGSPSLCVHCREKWLNCFAVLLFCCDFILFYSILFLLFLVHYWFHCI